MAKKEKKYNPVEAFNKSERQKKSKQKKDAKQEISKKRKPPPTPKPAKYELNPDDFQEVYTGPALHFPKEQVIDLVEIQEGVDLSYIKIPLGIAPETDGQMYDGLNLPCIKNNRLVGQIAVAEIPITQKAITTVSEKPSNNTGFFPGMPWEQDQVYNSSDDDEVPLKAQIIAQNATISSEPRDFSGAVVFAAPVRRDLMREVIGSGMVPASLQRKMLTKKKRE